jgi:hypothetical protein
VDVVEEVDVDVVVGDEVVVLEEVDVVVVLELEVVVVDEVEVEVVVVVSSTIRYASPGMAHAPNPSSARAAPAASPRCRHVPW